MNTESKDSSHPDADRDQDKALHHLICEGLAPIEPAAAQSAELRGRLLRRVGASARRHSGLITVRTGDGSWRTVKAGVRAKLLHNGARGASVLIELAPGATLPVHRHQHLEEGIVLRGGLQLGELNLAPGDYHVSPPGSRHARIGSREGGLAYLRGSGLGQTSRALGELLGGLLPGEGPPSHTVFASEDGWAAIAEGVEQKILWRDGDLISRFFRLAAGSFLPAHLHDGDEECMMLSGDAYFGDLLVRAGEFHLAPADSEHGALFSEHGALAFVHGRQVLPLPVR